ncbi:MAG: ATP-dependent Clp protease adaptor ClpS [Dehalococcoidia bacterium]|nr:ATP-dependent Clp protease adaptor ClpS [Dehalococcoidia bacterium]
MPETLTSPGTRVLEETEQDLEPPYHLVLLDDDYHTYQYVIEMLGAVFGYSREKGFGIACMVDSQGRAIVLTASKPQCERKQEQIHSYGADPRMEISQGSMSAVLEPAS